jgi:hypothetical protein
LSAREQRRAVEAFLEPLQQAISCVSRAVVLRGTGEGDGHAFMTLPERWTPLQGAHPLDLSFLHTYSLHERDGGWAVRSESYAYQVRWSGLGGPAELVAYHWHPDVVVRGRPLIHPHLHVKPARRPIDLSGAHVPTGRVSIEAVVRFLVEEVGVTPQRADWEAVLAANERVFLNKRSWG